METNNVPVKIIAITERNGVEGVTCEHGHWNKMPNGVRVDWSASFIKFWCGVCNGEKYIHCKQCNQENR